MAERVGAVCSCGAAFSRSVFNPYIVLCPACRRPLEEASLSSVEPEEARASLRASARALCKAADGDDEGWVSALGRLRAAARAANN